MSADNDTIIAAIEAPRTTYALAGHERARGAFLDAFAAGRLPHAWLISGPAGVGKATLAWQLTRHVLAAGQPAGEQPGAGQGADIGPGHPVSRLIAAGGHPDCRHVHRTAPPTGRAGVRTEITIGDIRALGPFLHQTPAYGGWRVAIVDTADSLNVNAANGLLKLLEEPPSRALLLLLADAPARLLPTIRSRCRHLPLRGLQPVEMDDFITGLDPDAAITAAARVTLTRLSNGCPGRAAKLYENNGLAAYDRLLAILETLPNLDMSAVMRAADDFGGARGEPAYRTFMDLLLWWLRDMIRGAAIAAPGQPALNQRLIGHPSLIGAWHDAWDQVRDLAARADSANLDRKQVVVQIFANLAAVANSPATSPPAATSRPAAASPPA